MKAYLWGVLGRLRMVLLFCLYVGAMAVLVMAILPIMLFVSLPMWVLTGDTMNWDVEALQWLHDRLLEL